MNRIVRENYPVSKLPEDLRGDIEPGASVTVTVVPEAEAAPKRMAELRLKLGTGQFLTRFAELRLKLGAGQVSLADAVERVRKIREGEAL